MDKERLEKLLNVLADKNMPIDKKSKWYQMYARLKFQNEGVKIKYLDADGKYIDFKPSAHFISISAPPLRKSRPSHVGSRPVPHKEQLYHPFQSVGEDALIIFGKDEE